jgi:hypothetical protein
VRITIRLLNSELVTRLVIVTPQTQSDLPSLPVATTHFRVNFPCNLATFGPDLSGRSQSRVIVTARCPSIKSFLARDHPVRFKIIEGKGSTETGSFGAVVIKSVDSLIRIKRGARLTGSESGAVDLIG